MTQLNILVIARNPCVPSLMWVTYTLANDVLYAIKRSRPPHLQPLYKNVPLVASFTWYQVHTHSCNVRNNVTDALLVSLELHQWPMLQPFMAYDRMIFRLITCCLFATHDFASWFFFQPSSSAAASNYSAAAGKRQQSQKRNMVWMQDFYGWVSDLCVWLIINTSPWIIRNREQN